MAADNPAPVSSGAPVKQIAIIGIPRRGSTRAAEDLRADCVVGAGSGGSSAAYYLEKFASDMNIRTNITVYEKSSYVGGRSTTVDVYDDPTQPVELGASIFVKANRNLFSAAEEFGLSTKGVGGARTKDSPLILGIWNGAEFVFRQNLGNNYWWNVAKLFWKYGWAPMRLQKLMKETVGKFLKMYETPHFPFRSLYQVVHDLDLSAAIATKGDMFLAKHSIEPPFSTEVIQASARVNYAQNLGLIHGLETMVCMSTDGAMAIKGGNWQIFDEMLKAAGAHVRLSGQVSEIYKNVDGTHTVVSSANDGTDVASQQQSDNFDTVILAAPLQFSDIKINPALAKPPDAIPYVKLQVTLFASPHLLSPSAFKLSDSTPVPQVILTTLPPDVDLGSRQDGVGPAGFFSLSTLGTVTNPSSSPPRTEFLYKAFSPEPLTAAFLSTVLGLPDPQGDLSSIPEEDVSWVYEKTWHSYPYLYPRVTFDEPQLDTNLWYTSGIESFISTMETSSLMGMNVARLVVDDWTDAQQ